MCAPATSVQVHVFILLQATPLGAAPTPRLPLAFLTLIPLPQTTPGITQRPSSLSGYPLQLRAASSRVEVTPDQLGGAPAPGGRMSQGRRQAAVGQLAQVASPKDGLSHLSVRSCLLKAFPGVSTGVRRLPLSYAAIDPGTQSPSPWPGPVSVDYQQAECSDGASYLWMATEVGYHRFVRLQSFLLASFSASLGTSV